MNPTLLIIVAIVAVMVGFLLGFLTRYLSDQDEDAEKKDAAQKLSDKKAPQKDWIEIANLWRDRRDGRLIFQIEDQHYKRGDELTIREREILLKIVMDFYRWLEPPSTLTRSSAEPAAPGVSAEGSSGDWPAAPFAERLQAASQMPVSPPPDVQASTSVVTRGIVSANVPVPETPLLSVVKQVNDILQEKIEAAGMQKWAIRLTESVNKSMIVWVGMERYEWIDEVPYKRVRDIIRESVAEWEQRADVGDPDQ